MSGILIPCPKCGSGLRLKDRTNLGKMGRCPKCATRFVLEEPEEVELELADASVPSTGTAGQWVPDSSGTARAASPAASGGGFGIDIETESPAEVQSNPTITEGMTLEEVVQLLGKPAKKKRMPDNRDYLLFQHKAGAYKLIFRENKVEEVHTQPEAQTTTNTSSPYTRKKPASPRNQKNKIIGISIGSVLALVVAGVLYFASQNKSPANIASNKESNKPGKNQTYEQHRAESKANFAAAEESAKAIVPTEGKPLTFERIPAGARIIVHLRPAELWSDELKFAQFRASMTTDFTGWIENAIKEHCLFEPKEIEEALICIYLGAQGDEPEVAIRAKLVKEHDKSEFLNKFQGVPTTEYGYPVYRDDKHVYVIDGEKTDDNKIIYNTFAVAPVARAEEVAKSRRPRFTSSDGIMALIEKTDREHHVTVLFEPFDLRLHKKVLVAENVTKILDEFLDWLEVDDVETAVWSMHLNEDNFYSRFQLRPKSPWTPAKLERDMQKKLKTMPAKLYQAVLLMSPDRVGYRKIIGRFPAMMKVYALSTLGGTGEKVAQFTTVLPPIAAPNLALGTMLAWHESTQPDYGKAPAKPIAKEPKLPDLIVDRFKTKMDAEFSRRPLQDAFDDIGEATSVKFEIDGDALKDEGYTKNMAQTFKLGEVPANEALKKILSQYDKMCICITDEDKNIVTVMTLKFAKKKGLTPMKF